MSSRGDADARPDPGATDHRSLTPLEQVAELTHRRALALAIEHGPGGQVQRLTAELHDARLQLTATEAELERLRALPELRAGQRVRHLLRRGAQRPPTPVPSTDRSEQYPSASPIAAPDRGLGYREPAAPAAIVVVRNRRRGLQPLLRWIGDHGVERIELVDDATSDPATLELLESLDLPIHRCDAQLGAVAAWAMGLVAELSTTTPVLVIDADTLPATECPDDVLARLDHELEHDRDVDAVELGVGTHPDAPLRPAPSFRLVRAGLPRLPARVAALTDPYVAVRASWSAASDDPDEAYARWCDEGET
jgi:hypothetical protein